jgi:ketosteroid isomerase-like protein
MRHGLRTALIGLLGLAGLRPAAAQREQNGQSARAQANLALARQDVEAFTAGEMQGSFALPADDIVWEVNGGTSITPVPGRREGIDAVRAWSDGMIGFCGVADFNADRLFADGDTVTMLVHERDRAAQTGAELEQRCAAFRTFSAGKLARYPLFDASALEYLVMQSAAPAKAES